MEIILSNVEKNTRKSRTEWFIEDSEGKLIPISDFGKIVDKSGDWIKYKISVDENTILWEFSFNNRGTTLFVRKFKAGDFKEDSRPEPRYSTLDPNEIVRLFKNKIETNPDDMHLIKEYLSLHPHIYKLFFEIAKVDEKYFDTSPATYDAIQNPEYFILISQIFRMSRSLKNIIKYFKQLYEIKFLVEALDAEIEHIDIQRTGSYRARYSNLKVNNPIIYDALDQIQITFRKPNIILKRKNGDYYTIWYEFSFTKYIRPDFFILKGKHESPFNESVYEYLSEVNDDFWEKIIDEWKYILRRIFFGSDYLSSSGPSDSEIEQFLLGLVEHLKEGLVLESKESESDFKSKNTFRQLEIYPKIFHNQKLVLLSWKKVPVHITEFEVIENFENDENARNKLVELIVNM